MGDWRGTESQLAGMLMRYQHGPYYSYRLGECSFGNAQRCRQRTPAACRQCRQDASK